MPSKLEDLESSKTLLGYLECRRTFQFVVRNCMTSRKGLKSLKKKLPNSILRLRTVSNIGKFLLGPQMIIYILSTMLDIF